MSFSLYAVRVFVFDWKAALEFYEKKIGLPLLFQSEEMGWAEFKLNNTRLAIERLSVGDPDAMSLVGRFIGLSLKVENLEDTFQTLTSRGVEFVSPPETQQWGATLASFKDPEGNVLTLLQKPKATLPIPSD